MLLDESDDSFGSSFGYEEGSSSSIAESFHPASSSMPGSSHSDDLRRQCIAMGFSSVLVDRALAESDCRYPDDVAALILAMQEKPPSLEEIFKGKVSSEMIAEARNACGANASDERIADFLLRLKDDEHKSVAGELKTMGFPDAEISEALQTHGTDANLDAVVNHILAKQQTAPAGPSRPVPAATYDLDSIYRDWDASNAGKKRWRNDDYNDDFDDSDDELDRCGRRGFSRGRTQTGFGIPGGPVVPRTLSPRSNPPPFFYFENVASMPRGSWEEISRFLDGVQPEIVNSKWFCAASRPRGYIHNLPVTGRRALPSGPMTLQELIPGTERFYPQWDNRTKLSCITTSSDRAARIQKEAERYYDSDDVDPEVFRDVKRHNLVWRASRTLAPLEVAEVETVQGFDIGHTSCGQAPGERIKALGNAMQVHTVAWHLSVLKPEFPDGIRVLSLFSGIGGLEVALDKLGIPIKFLVCVESNEDSRRVLKAWWSRTKQRGTHIVLNDVKELTPDRIEDLVAQARGFDLVAGGSPCNNFSGNNRTSRTGITGDQSRLFYDYFRILREVRDFSRRS